MGRTAPATLGAEWRRHIEADQRYTFCDNGRFKGGYITRHYADVEHNIYSIQLELTQSTYLDESYITKGSSPSWDDKKAQEIRPLLTHLISASLVQCANAAKKIITD